MGNQERIARYTSEELQQMVDSGQDRTDWDRLEAMSKTELSSTVDDDEGHADWLHATTALPKSKQQLTVRFDLEVVDWFRSQGPGYQTRMNQVLRRYVEAHTRKS